jgi:CRISPR/Cas system Type II protein with McrA/HNH and RuvC-like nuclease domain
MQFRGEIMDQKKIEKQYVYIREQGKCYFCGKEVLLKKVSLDHYLPKSAGGPNDSFNLVLSCKRCNKLKKSTIPKDYGEVLLRLFQKAVRDEKIIGSGLKMKHQELIELANHVYGMETIGEYTMFQSKTHRFYVKHNKIMKVDIQDDQEV